NCCLATPRLLSQLIDSPTMRQSAILCELHAPPENGYSLKTGGKIPPYVYIVLISVFLFGIWRILEAIWTFREARHPPEPEVRAPRFQATVWACLMAGAIVAICTGHGILGVVLVVVGVMLPTMKRKKA